MNRTSLFINLDSLLDLSNTLISSRDVEFILNTALLSLMGKLGFFRACAFRGQAMPFALEQISTKGNFSQDTINILIEKLKGLGNKNQRIVTIAEPSHLLLQFRFGFDKFAVLYFERKAISEDYSHEELQYVHIVCNLISSSLENAYNYQSLLNSKIELEKRNQVLLTIYELNKDLSSLLTRDKITSYLRYLIFGQLLVNKFALFYKINDIPESIYNNTGISFSAETLEHFFELKETVSFDELKPFSHSSNENFDERRLSLVCPIKVQNQTTGVLILSKKYNNENFTAEDLRFLEILGNNLGQAFENLRLIEQEIKQKQIEKELELARTIQQNLLPKNFRQISDFECFGLSIPAKVVGGDYFDFIPFGTSSFYFAIADVSGKGIPAALLMANVQAGLRVLAELNLPLKEIVNRINQLVLDNTEPDKFVTFFIGRIDATNKTLEYINAGHNPPIYFSPNSNEIRFLSKGGLILGSFESPMEFETEVVILNSGDLILAYTDGITECSNSNGTEFGMQNLVDFVRKRADLCPKELCHELISEISNFSNSNEFADDVTVFAVKIK